MKPSRRSRLVKTRGASSSSRHLDGPEKRLKIQHQDPSGVAPAINLGVWPTSILPAPIVVSIRLRLPADTAFPDPSRPWGQLFATRAAAWRRGSRQVAAIVQQVRDGR